MKYEWQPIKEFDHRLKTAVKKRLGDLAPPGLYSTIVPTLRARGGLLGQLAEQMKRDWCVQTGLIEFAYQLTDPEITRLLTEGFNSASQINQPEPDKLIQTLKSHEYVYDTLELLNAEDRPLTTSLIKQIHVNMMAHQQEAVGVDQFGNKYKTKLRMGEYKINANNPLTGAGHVHEYCPYEHVDSEMENLLRFHQKNIQRRVHPVIQAAWLHQNFIAIHPFQDGNGRVGRALSTMVLRKNNFLPFTVSLAEKQRYLRALDAGNHGDISNLVEFFIDMQLEIVRGIQAQLQNAPARPKAEGAEK